MPLAFWINLIIILGENFAAEHPQQHRFRGFRILAMDGTRLDLPTCKALKDHFGTAKNSSGQHQPQARMVMLQFPFTRLPYRYELAPLADGEVTMALRLITHLQGNDLVLLDAGYWSYQLLWGIANRDAYFAIRLRKRLSLSKVRNLQPDGQDRLVRWTPKDSRGQWKKLDLPKSIDLRVIHYRVPGYRPQAIVTNVLQPQQISRADWTRLTTDCTDARRKLLPGLFHRRWEVETSFHELKVDLGLDRHLRSHTPGSIQFEVAGYVVLYLLIRWLIVEAAVKHGLDPLRISFVEAVRELDAMRPSLLSATPQWAAQVLLPRLLDRIAAHRVPVRPGRHYPRKKKRRKPGKKSGKRPSAKKQKAGQKETKHRGIGKDADGTEAAVADHCQGNETRLVPLRRAPWWRGSIVGWRSGGQHRSTGASPAVAGNRSGDPYPRAIRRGVGGASELTEMRYFEAVSQAKIGKRRRDGLRE